MDSKDADSSDASFGDFMGGIEEHVLNLIKETNKAPKDAWEAWTAFAAAIKWSEPWIIGLVCFHITCLLLTIVFRKRSNVQGVLFLVLCALVFLAEKINSACSQRWQAFATQNYFDNRGVFASVMFAGPLLGIATIILVSYPMQCTYGCTNVSDSLFHSFAMDRSIY